MVPSRLIGPLGSAAHPIITSALTNGAPGQATLKKEPDFVAAVVIGAMPNIAAAWKPILSPAGISLRIEAVFCHGRPQVDFTTTPSAKPPSTPKTCELADMLLVVEDATSGAPPTRRAALIQAKMAKSKLDQVQFDLLSNWPVFTFNQTIYDPRSRDFVAGVSASTAGSSGVYGVIQRPPSPDWRQTPPARPLPTTGLELGHFMARMADAPSTAEGRSATIGGTDDWSFTIDELLSVTAARTFTLTSLGSSSSLRGHSHVAFIHHAPSGILGGHIWVGGGGGEPPEGDEPPRGEGLSFVRIRFEGGGELLRD